MTREQTSLCPHVGRSIRFKEQYNLLLGMPLVGCVECKKSAPQDSSLWICLTCSHIGCGIRGHAFSHAARQLHPLALELNTGTCHCYKCDSCVSPSSSADLQILYKYLLSCYHINQTKFLGKSSRVGTKRKSPDSKSKAQRAKRKKLATPGLIGLQNLGNTCYMNSVLQVLSHTEPLRSFFLSMLDDMAEKYRADCAPVSILPRISRHTKEEPPVKPVSLVAELRDIIRDLWFHDAPTHSPTTFLTSMWSILPRFYGTQQHDTHEFLRSLLERLNIEFLSSRTRRNRNTVQGIFQGTLFSELMCKDCGSKKTQREAFLDISLDIPSLPNDATLYDCIDNFMAEEDLDPELFCCSKCDSIELTKKFTIKDLPSVLCLHLKRFRWEAQKRTKITTHLDVPLQLNLQDYCTQTEPSSYQLYGMVSHHGKKSGCGHYTAHCEMDDQWFHFNDRTVKICSVEDLQKQQAYLLFYQKIQEPTISSSTIPPTKVIDLCN